MKTLVREKGESLWPNKFSIEDLELIKRTQSNKYWSALYQCSPTTEEGSYFKRDYFRYYKELPKDITYKVYSWDTADEMKDTAAYSVCQLWGESPTGFYLIDEWREKVEFPTLEITAKSLYQKTKVNKVLIENKASGKALIKVLRHSTKIPIKEINPTSSKENRADNVIGQFESGNVYIPENKPWIYDWINEFIDFPSGEYMDRVDAATQAIDFLVFKKRVVKLRRL